MSCDCDRCTCGDPDCQGPSMGSPWHSEMRTFDSGATRDNDHGKLNYRRFFSPRVFKRRAEYMEEHRVQADGNLRDPDNWKKGIPLEAYADSEWRHHFELWEMLDTGWYEDKQILDTICALMFNLEGMADLILREQENAK